MSKKGGGGVKETPEEQALAEIALERYNDYQQRFVPVENQTISEVMGNIEDPSNFGRDMANIATQQQFSAAEQGLASGLTARGARPGSGAFTGGLMDLNTARTASSAQGQAQATGLETSRNINNLQSLVGMGQGIATSGIQGMSTLADIANQQAIMDARAAYASRQAVGNAIGTGAGMYYGSQTNNQLTPNVQYPAAGNNGTGQVYGNIPPNTGIIGA